MINEREIMYIAVINHDFGLVNRSPNIGMTYGGEINFRYMELSADSRENYIWEYVS